MKKGLLLIIFGFMFIIGKAQYVAIPDTNFVKWLNTNGYNQCLSGNLLDTTCGPVVDAIKIDCQGSGIHDLTGLEHFQNLDTLICIFNSLTSLPSLPNTLSYLECWSNDLMNLPNLPASLTFLDCQFNNITGLPLLPSNLKYLDCGYSQIHVLPNLPNELRYLSCSGNQLTALPQLPDSLRVLGCASNQITTIPTLPGKLTALTCYDNQIISLPVLPITLTLLNCHKNQLTGIPDLPNHLIYLICNNNKLSSLPELPDSLNQCSIDSNVDLHCLPLLKRIVHFTFTGTGINCLPNHSNITFSTPSVNVLSICDSTFNSNGCQLFNIIESLPNIQPFISIFPNPTSNQLNINIDETLVGAQLNLYNLTGALVQTAMLATGNTQLSTEGLPAGVYVAEIKTKETSVKKRWVKM